MSKIKKRIGILITVIASALVGIVYFFLESVFYSDFGCGCSSLCMGFYPTAGSRILGYGLLMGSATLFIASIWRIKSLSRLWTIPAVIVFCSAWYGNGYMLFNKGNCGYSLNQTTFFIFQKKLGDFAKADAETIDTDSLKAGKLKGKLLGYSIKGNELTAFRIGEDPIKVKTSFLFWKVRNELILDNLSYGLNTFRNFEAEKTAGNYEFIGGKGMSESDFLDEFVLTQKAISSAQLFNKQIRNADDGTTRFLFSTNP